jgi:hypothetical protein
VYRKFGHAAEAAQLLEAALGRLLAAHGATSAAGLEHPAVNREALGQMLKSMKIPAASIAKLETLLAQALTQNDRLTHSFYREHNFRINSDDGRATMMRDLESIHNTLLDAFKEVLRLTGIDLDKAPISSLPKKHVPV